MANTDFLTAMEPGSMQWTIARNLVKYAAGTAMFCPRCEAILDQSRTVVLSDGTRTVTMCDQCYGKSPGNIKRGSIEVYDGRVLFAKPRKAKRTR